MNRATSAMAMIAALAVAWSSASLGAGDATRGSTLYHTTYQCTACHSSNPQPGDIIASGATVDGLLNAIHLVPEMKSRFLNTLGQNATDQADLAAYIDSVTNPIASVTNYQGLWWASPAGSESGWGINFAHQGDVIFATWFTDDTTGKAWWLSMTATKTAPNVYGGTLYQTNGPAFSATPFDPTKVTRTAVGTATLTFTDANTAQFAYVVNGSAQTKTLTRQVFAVLPTCTFGAQPNLALATNYQDLWWAAPPGAESGWGINLTEQSNVIFGTWFTYDLDGTPLWLSVTAESSSAGVYTGTLYRTRGPAFNAVPFNPANVTRTSVGTATLSFSDGANATFAYTVNGVAQTKNITRQVFVTPGTVCQ